MKFGDCVHFNCWFIDTNKVKKDGYLIGQDNTIYTFSINIFSKCKKRLIKVTEANNKK